MTAIISSAYQAHADKQAASQPSPMGRFNTASAMVSVTLPNVCPGSYYRWFIRPGHVLQNRFFFWSLLHR